jgi:hypothetical protein
MAAMPLARFSLDLSADRPPVVTINGGEHELPIVALTVRHVPPSLPQFILELAGEVTVTGEGVVAIGPEQRDEIAYLRTFLANLDPETLERQALERITECDTTGEAFVAALRAMVNQPS